MFCPYCGKEINEESNFCKFCGKNVNDNVNTSNTSKTEDILGILCIVIAVLSIIVGIIWSTYNHFNPQPQTNEEITTQERRPELEVTNARFCWSLSPKAICGRVVNNGIRSSEDFRMNINLYDSQDKLIGNIDTIAHSCTMSGFSRCEKWNFKIPVSNPKVKRFEIVKVSW